MDLEPPFSSCSLLHCYTRSPSFYIIDTIFLFWYCEVALTLFSHCLFLYIICIIRVLSCHCHSVALWSFCHQNKFFVCVNNVEPEWTDPHYYRLSHAERTKDYFLGHVRVIKLTTPNDASLIRWQSSSHETHKNNNRFEDNIWMYLRTEL